MLLARMRIDGDGLDRWWCGRSDGVLEIRLHGACIQTSYQQHGKIATPAVQRHRKISHSLEHLYLVSLLANNDKQFLTLWRSC